MKLRYYQEECIAAVYDYFRKYRGNPICALPTGSGKSYVIAEFLRRMFCSWPHSRALMLTHVKELIEQNMAELLELWPMAPAGIYSAGIGRKEIRPITFAGIMSIVGKGRLLGHVDIVLIDECHLLGPDDDTAYQLLLAELLAINPKLKVIGLTATPYRLKQGLLTEPTWKDGKLRPPIFTDICFDITKLEAFNRLISEGYLCNLVPRRTDTALDVSKVDVVGGEFVQGQLQEAVDHSEITYAAIAETIRLGSDRKHWLVFGTGEQHCAHIVSTLEAQGIPARMVTSKTGKEDRKKFIAEFKAGAVRALVNNKIFTTGFNFKPIDLIVDLQPTQSPSKHVQKYGRGTRMSLETGKIDCLVLDFARNTRRLGPINDPRIPRNKKSVTGTGESQAPVKVCITCNTYNHAAARFCTKCGEEFPPPSVAIEASAGTDALIIGAAPVIEVFEVTNVDYKRFHPHRTSGKPDSLKVNYFCGPIRAFSDWVCLEHIGFASKRARDWWKVAADDHTTEPPKDVTEALTRLQELQRPSHLRVWVNCPEPKIQAYDYSGTAFGTKLPKQF